MSEKIWFPTHPRNFGSEKNRPYLRPPLHVSRGEILHFKHSLVLTVNCTASRTFRDKKQQKANSFFRLNFDVYIDVDNRGRAKEREKEG